MGRGEGVDNTCIMVTPLSRDMSLSAFENLEVSAMAILGVRVLGDITDLQYSQFVLQKVRYLVWYGCIGEVARWRKQSRVECDWSGFRAVCLRVNVSNSPDSLYSFPEGVLPRQSDLEPHTIVRTWVIATAWILRGQPPLDPLPRHVGRFYSANLFFPAPDDLSPTISALPLIGKPDPMPLSSQPPPPFPAATISTFLVSLPDLHPTPCALPEPLVFQRHLRRPPYSAPLSLPLLPIPHLLSNSHAPFFLSPTTDPHNRSHPINAPTTSPPPRSRQEPARRTPPPVHLQPSWQSRLMR